MKLIQVVLGLGPLLFHSGDTPGRRGHDGLEQRLECPRLSFGDDFHAPVVKIADKTSHLDSGRGAQHMPAEPDALYSAGKPEDSSFGCHLRRLPQAGRYAVKGSGLATRLW
jgi:hypothetical protein